MNAPDPVRTKTPATGAAQVGIPMGDPLLRTAEYPLGVLETAYDPVLEIEIDPVLEIDPSCVVIGQGLPTYGSDLHVCKLVAVAPDCTNDECGMLATVSPLRSPTC